MKNNNLKEFIKEENKVWKLQLNINKLIRDRIELIDRRFNLYFYLILFLLSFSYLNFVLIFLK